MIPNTNDGSNTPPRLAPFMNMGTMMDLPPDSGAPTGEGAELLRGLREADYEGAQSANPEHCREAGIKAAAFVRADKPGELLPKAEKAKAEGNVCLTLHCGRGFESDAEAVAICEDIVAVSQQLSFPIYLETHRATITQDPWRTLQFIKEVPDIRINGDFSHWYTGLELPYGGIDWKLDLLEPVFDRVRFMHGRIGDASNMQVAVQADGTADHLVHFREMWTRAMAGFLRNAAGGDYLVFAPELLPPRSLYARVFETAPGQFREESNRWQQASVYTQIARECFAEAEKRT